LSSASVIWELTGVGIACGARACGEAPRSSDMVTAIAIAAAGKRGEMRCLTR